MAPAVLIFMASSEQDRYNLNRPLDVRPCFKPSWPRYMTVRTAESWKHAILDVQGLDCKLRTGMLWNACTHGQYLQYMSVCSAPSEALGDCAAHEAGPGPPSSRCAGTVPPSPMSFSTDDHMGVIWHMHEAPHGRGRDPYPPR